MGDELDTRLAGIELPTDVADVLGEVRPAAGRPRTLADVADPPEEWLPAGNTISASAMYRDEETRHAVHLADGVEHVPCVLDALIVGFLAAEDPVRIESESPGGDSVVEYRVSGDVVDATPEDAVVSFAIAPRDAAGITYGDDFEDDPRIASCSYINSFPDERAYERWANATDAPAAMGLSVDEAAVFARHFAASPVFEPPG